MPIVSEMVLFHRNTSYVSVCSVSLTVKYIYVNPIKYMFQCQSTEILRTKEQCPSEIKCKTVDYLRRFILNFSKVDGNI